MRPFAFGGRKETLRFGLAVLVVLSAACGSSGPAMPTAPTQSAPAPSTTPPPTSSFPDLAGPSRTFVFDHQLERPVSGYTRTSRLTLYDDGAFLLQYPSLNGPGYRGAYTVVNGQIDFQWDAVSVAGAWGATGSLDGDELTVRYNVMMQLDDFDDAAYTLVR